jgi:dTDP-4-amino-4,6-dideoxygalactose transaminase
MEAARSVITSGRFILGEHNAAFEEAFATYCGVRHAVTVNSGTSALHLALLAAGVGPGDEVITVPATFVATVAAIQYANATARLVDVDPVTWTMDPSQLEAAITPRTKAIIPVHLHGRLADMASIMDIARAYGLTVIEDAAQAHGAEAEGRRAGAIGDLGCFSFYPGKNLGACGEGGAVTTNSSELAARLRSLRDWGQVRKYLHADKGFNHRLDELQAALLNVKLPHLDEWTAWRRKAAARYDSNLLGSGIRHAASGNGRDHVYHVYAVRVADRDMVRAALEPEIATGIHYPIPVHLQPAYADLGYRLGEFPVSEQLADETLSLPIFPGISDNQVDRVCDALRTLCHPAPQVA